MSDDICSAAATPRRPARVAHNGVLARLLLAMLSTAGLYYVNIMPALVNGLIDALGFSNRDAGLVGSANVYGAALGALTSVFLVKRVPWRAAAALLLVGLMSLDALSMLITTPVALIAVRFLHGCVGGLLVGVGFSVSARTAGADRTFGFLLLVQFGLGGLGVMLLPPLVVHHGIAVLFWALIAFSAVTLALLPAVPDYPVTAPARDGQPKRAPVRVPLLLCTLLSLFLYQASNMGLFAFIIGLGEHYGQSMPFISPVLGASAWVGILGALLVIVLGTRWGRVMPLLAGMVFTIAGTALLHFSAQPWAFIVANVGVGITWTLVIPYLFGMCAEFDQAGQLAALGGFASKLGLASGPALAALLLGHDDYARLINLSLLAMAASTVVGLVPAVVLDRVRRTAA